MPVPDYAPIETFSSYGIDVTFNSTDKSQIESALGNLWREWFHDQSTEELGSSSINCAACRLAVGILMSGLVNEAMVATGATGVVSIQTIINTPNWERTYEQFKFVVEQFLQKLQIPLGATAFLKLVDVEHELDNYMVNAAEYLCTVVGACPDGTYSGEFVFTNKLGWSITSGMCGVVVGDNRAALQLAGLANSGSSDAQKYDGEVKGVQVWAFNAYTSGGDEGYTWQASLEISDVAEQEAAAVTVVADAEQGQFIVTLADGRSGSTELIHF